jgi:hypothetical protein
MPLYASRKFKVIFLTTRKCGTISFKKFASEHPELDLKGISKKQMKEFNKTGAFTNYIITRNPYSRAISSWQRARFLNADMFESDITLPTLKCFKNFLREIETVKERHWEEQRKGLIFLKDYKQIKIENIEYELRLIFKRKCKFPHNHSHLDEKKKMDIPDYREFYDEEAKELVKKRYKFDLEIFNYDF